MSISLGIWLRVLRWNKFPVTHTCNKCGVTLSDEDRESASILIAPAQEDTKKSSRSASTLGTTR